MILLVAFQNSLNQQNKKGVFSIGEKNSICQKKNCRGEEEDTEGHGAFHECRCGWVHHTFTRKWTGSGMNIRI